ncbi:MAG: DUF6786 family protein [Planctomycetota bacterium]
MSADADYAADLALIGERAGVHELHLGPLRLAVVPAWQLRVATGAFAPDGRSLGWLNRPKLRSGEVDARANLWGGLERLWLGPEGGPGTVYFAPGDDYRLDRWTIPALVDRVPFQVASAGDASIAAVAEGPVLNRAGERFEARLERRVELLEPGRALGAPLPPAVQGLGFVSDNALFNVGASPWSRSNGGLCLWLAGMLPHAEHAVAYAPAPAVATPHAVGDYFHALDATRLRPLGAGMAFRVDGAHRSKIGIPAANTTGWMGAWDPERGRLTLVQAEVDASAEYLEARWSADRGPFGGEALHLYNDGPPEPGAAPFGPFFELESSSPAAVLGPGERRSHRSTTILLEGPSAMLDDIARARLGVSLSDLERAFRAS